MIAKQYHFKKYTGRPAPIIISIPHMGTEIPSEIAKNMDPVMLSQLSDTDWIVDQLYPFASRLGISVLKANYSRYVIDLNRPVNSSPLYQDGRQETTIVPYHNFDGRNLYRPGLEPTKEDIAERIAKYYDPYHQKLQNEIKKLKASFDTILLFEAHSIRRFVPKLYPNPFPDLMLGNQNNSTCPQQVIDRAERILASGSYQVSKNQPFMGGFITRSFANVDQNIYTLQLEKSQDIYLAKDRTLQQEKGEKLIITLENMFLGIIEELKNYENLLVPKYL